MSRRSITVLPGSRDGTSQRSRRLAALDPDHAPIDERTRADVLGFVQAYAAQLRFLEADGETGGLRSTGTWADFVRRADISIGDIAAYVADPTRFTGEQARWLGRPHVALLLTFVELLAHARDHLNGFTRRHLDHYYRDLLQIRPEPPAPDRAMVVFGLRPGATEAWLPAGTELQAGRDDSGAPRIYRTERAIVVNRAAVAQVRSVFVDRRITGIPDVRTDRSLTAPQALTRTLAIALGSPGPGDPVPAWDAQPVNTAFLVGLREGLDFATASLELEHHELRSMMRLVAQRDGAGADAEWAEINRLLGVTSPSDPRDFQANLEARVGPLDFAADGLPQVNSVDDLYTYRTEAPVRAYIDDRLRVVGFDSFVAAMQIKLRIDAEWAEINRLLERAGRRQREVLAWSLPPGDATDFAGNLAAALQGAWPPPWPSGTTGIADYDAWLRRLERHLAMPVERIETLVAFAEELGLDPQSEAHNWSDVDRILADAHREKLRAARVTTLVELRAGAEDAKALDTVASFVLGATPPLAWTDARARLAAHLEPSRLDLLARFRDALVTGEPMFGFGWHEADDVFEQAWRDVQQLPPPIAQQIEVHNVYAYDDATQVKDRAAAPGWKTFGGKPPVADPTQPRGAALGWALRSPLLSLSEGTRTLTVTLGLRRDGFGQAEQAVFLAALGLGATERSGDRLAHALEAVLAIEVSTTKGWIGLDLARAQLATGAAGDDYWSLRGVARVGDQDRPALQLQAIVDPSADPLAPPPGDRQLWPALRVLLRPRWNADAGQWQTSMETFAPLVLAAVHLKVEVDGLVALRLQQDDRSLDPRKPIEPFGSRPAVGTRLYLDHPELVRARLGSLRFDIEWMGLPPTGLRDHYLNYPGLTGDSGVFKARVSLIDRSFELVLANVSLFADQAGTQSMRTLAIANVPAAIESSSPGVIYDSRSDLTPASDVRQASRYLRWELTPVDFGHGVNASLAASKARELAVAMAAGTVKTAAAAAAYRVELPYTPTIKTLRVGYATAVEIEATAVAVDHQLLHVHPFGACPIDAALPSFVPRHDAAGELYIGVRDLRPPQHLALLLQVAEGTSDPDIAPAAVTWSYLDGDRFQDLSGSGIIDDTTRGLRNAGIVELALPAAASGSRLAPELYWLRLAIPRNSTSVCDLVSIRAQAAAVRFDDRGNAPAHYEQPLPAGSIERLLDPDARIARVEQPYSSFGGRPAEPADLFDTRVSERLRHKNRALSAWDYERLVLHRFRQIYKARCRSSSGGVDVIVIPDIRALSPSDTFAPRAPANLLADIEAYLVERAPAAARIRVRNARYVAVQVRLGVRFRDGVDAGFAQRRLNDDLVRFLSPWAFDDGAELTIGGRIYANSILDFIDRRDDVDFVADIKLFRSANGTDFDLVPPVVGEYHVAADRPDQVLVAAQHHYFDIIPNTGYRQASFTGIDYARIELDFIVG